VLIRQVEAVQRCDSREAGPPLLIRRVLDGCSDSRLAGSGRPGDPEQEAAGRAVDGGQQPGQSLAEPGCDYSLLDAAQRLIPLSVA
jgi:hypothetical protein